MKNNISCCQLLYNRKDLCFQGCDFSVLAPKKNVILVFFRTPPQKKIMIKKIKNGDLTKITQLHKLHFTYF